MRGYQPTYIPSLIEVGLLSRLIHQVTLNHIIINDHVCTGLTAASWQDLILPGKENGKFSNVEHELFYF